MTSPEIVEVDYHRNGISGRGFYVGIINDPNHGRMLVVHFPTEEGEGDDVATAVLQLDKAATGNIYMHPEGEHAGGNAWRGDHYHHLGAAFRDEVGRRSNERMAQWGADRKAAKA